MNNPILIVTLILFGISAVFRLITHILEIRERNQPQDNVGISANVQA
jgi:hypothetical protein